MTRSVSYLLATLLVLAVSIVGLGQATSTGSLSGTITDPKGGLVPGATIVVKSTATGQEFTAQTNNDGYFRIPSVNSGVYTATINGQGFKQVVVTDIKVDVGLPSTVNVQMELGQQTETVTVVGGGELLRTENATVGSTLIGRQITDIPTASRDALDLVLTMPGTQTPGRPRSSTINGLPRGALNISIDGINVQDNNLRSNDGFFTYVRPRTDAVDEVTVSTATPGAESSGEGAVQIKFTTKGGGNEYHGGLYWYHRNPALNANYWFFNRDNPVDKNGKAQQQRILLNQPGGKVGGPISIPGLFNGKDRAFFFVNYEEYRLPETQPRTRTVFLPGALTGTFRYGTGGANSVNLLSIAAASSIDCVPGVAGVQACASTVDPTVSTLLNQIKSSVTSATHNVITNDFNRENVSFVNTGGQVRKFPTVRFDFNLSKNHHLENIWNYQQFVGKVDFLNNVDPSFPGFPNFRNQNSNRFSNSTALRSTLTQSIVNEARFGLTGGTTLFGSETDAAQFSNQGGYSLGINAAGITSATASNAPSRRNSPVWEFSDNLTWTKGEHSLTLGTSYTRINFWQYSAVQLVPTITFSVPTADPAFNLFGPTTMPNSTTADQDLARNFYAVLTGRVSSVGASGIPDEAGNYVTLGPRVQRARQEEWGYFGQDTWRVKPNLTLTLGLRWEIQGPFEGVNSTWSSTTYKDLFGVSGEGNLFRPGVLTGTGTTFTAFSNGYKSFSTKYGNLAPSFGFTYSPNFQSGFLNKLAGNSGQTVIRGGFSMAYVREGLANLTSIFGSNPGGGAGIDATKSVSLGNLPTGTLLRNGGIAPVQVSGQVTYPVFGAPFPPGLPSNRQANILSSANTFHPDLNVGYAESFQFGVQREITSDTVVEARYVGTRSHRLWRQYNLDEVNAVENGFANEFRLAQQNLLSNLECARTAGCTGGGATFKYRGAGTGTFPLPIFLATFSGANPTNAGNSALYTSTFFTNSTLLTALSPLAPNIASGSGGAASFLAGVGSTANNNNAQTFRNNRDAAGLAPNLFVVNPDMLGGAFVIDNGGQTWYDALQLELRRRLSRGLLLQASYTFSKSEANTLGSDSATFSQYPTLRDPFTAKGLSQYDITHAFKANFIYELPIGRGQKWLTGSSKLVDGFVGGWGINGSIRMNSGSPFRLGHVQLVGMTAKELQDSVKVRYDPTGAKNVFYLPQDIIDNTRRAFLYGIVSNNITYQAPSGLTGNTAPTGRFIAPPGYGNCLEAYVGQCGFTDLTIKGPNFFRSDISVVKKIKFTENTNFELRAEFLNAFNNINFRIGSAANDFTTITPTLNNQNTGFGITTTAYQDISTTNDPGGRMVQLVLRFNF
jgi:hypothetical protein